MYPALKTLALACLLAATALLLATPAFAAPGDVLRTYDSPAAPEAANFGSSVASYAGKVVASAPNISGGMVYLINPVTGESSPLPKPQGVTYGTFGTRVLAKGTKLYVSDPDAIVSGTTGSGALFVYSSPSDSSPLILSNPADAPARWFAMSFDANSSGEVIIGDPTEEKAYVYAPGAATHRYAIDSPKTYQTWFGYQVAISDAGTLVVGHAEPWLWDQEIHLFHQNGQYFTSLRRPSEHGFWYTLIGNELAIENEILYTADLASLPVEGPNGPTLQNGRAIYSFDLATAELLTSYTETGSDRTLGASLHFVNGLLAVGSPTFVSTPNNNLDPVDDEIVFLNPDLSFVARATRPAAEGIGSHLASLGGYLIAGAPKAADLQGKVHLMATPNSGSDTTLPDLTAPELTVQTDCKSKTSKKGTKTTCKLTGTITVSNQGFVDSGKKKASITIYHSTDATLSPDDTRAGKAKIANIPAFGSAIATFKGKTKTATTGTYLIAVIDDKNQLPESSETNNQLIHGPMP